ncbi:MAG: TonB-dependent receptor plug domain-containing protein [Gemmatimonadaceae bacterium]
MTQRWPRCVTSRFIPNFAGLALMTLQLTGVVGAANACAQDTTIVHGRIIDARTRHALVGVLMEITESSSSEVSLASTLTTANGRFVLRAAANAHQLRATLLGYKQAGVALSGATVAGNSAEIELALEPLGTLLDPIVVSVSRAEQRASAAPATVTVVEAARIEEEATVTPVEHTRDAPGVDIATAGIIQSHIVTRGFNGVFSGALLVLTDYRFDMVPSLRVNTPWLIPTTNNDIDRIEVVLGPAAALYGPNAAAGVLHIFTKSPFDSPGTTVSATGISRSANGTGAAGGGEQLAIRHAGTLGTRFGYKATAQYMKGTDWRELDSAESTARRSMIAAGFDSSRILIGQRDFDVSRWSLDGEAEFRPDDRSEIVLAAGRAHAGRAIALTGVGAAQVRDWSLDHYQARFRRDELFGQVFLNVNDAGQTYLLRSGNLIVDNSRMLVGQLQNAADFGARETLTYGADGQRTDPRTGGTIDGRNENDDIVAEVGGYVQSETHLTPRVDAILAARVDNNDRLPNAVFSPRAAIQFRPTDGHVIRLTYNRAFETPTAQDLFSDFPAAIGAGGLPFVVRSVGVPRAGFSFAHDCGGAGGLCMQSPYTGGQATPVDATLAWARVVALARALNWGDLSGIPAPTKADVASVLRVADISGATPSFTTVEPTAVGDIPALRPTVTNTLEGGYKGRFGDRLQVAFDLYYEWRKDFIGPPQVITPTVFLDPGTLATYLSKYMSAAAAADVAAKIAGINGSAATPGLPLGTVAPTGSLGGSADLLVTYRNFGSLHRAGSDIAAQWIVGAGLSLSGAYSWTNRVLWNRSEMNNISDVALNAPGDRASLALQMRDGARGFSTYLRVRHAGAFPMNSGVYVGNVAAYTLTDAGLSYRVPQRSDLLLTLSADNLLDARHREFVGAPEIGRLVLVQLQYSPR